MSLPRSRDAILTFMRRRSRVEARDEMPNEESDNTRSDRPARIKTDLQDKKYSNERRASLLSSLSRLISSNAIKLAPVNEGPVADATTSLSIPKPLVVGSQETNFDEYNTTTRQLSTIIITPAQLDASAVFCIRDAIHFGERYVFDYIMYIGHQSPPMIIEPLKYAIGLVRALPKCWIFEIGNPMVRSRGEDELPDFGEYACQNQVMKKKGVVMRLQGAMMRWEFKADLSKEGPLSKLVWLGTRKNRKLVELELQERDASKRVLAVWRSEQSQDPYRGHLWLRRDFPEDLEGTKVQDIQRRWAVAVWLTWRVLSETDR